MTVTVDQFDNLGGLQQGIISAAVGAPKSLFPTLGADVIAARHAVDQALAFVRGVDERRDRASQSLRGTALGALAFLVRWGMMGLDNDPRAERIRARIAAGTVSEGDKPLNQYLYEVDPTPESVAPSPFGNETAAMDEPVPGA